MKHLMSSRIAAAAGGALMVLVGVVAAGAITDHTSRPTEFVPATADGPGEDLSGPCDEAEHALDPSCTGSTPTTATSTTGAAGPQEDPTDPSVRQHSGDDGRIEATRFVEPGATGPRTLDAAGAGTVTYDFDGSSFVLLGADPAAGWRVDVESAAGIELDLDFRSATQRVQVDIELEDGQIRERVRLRDELPDDDAGQPDDLADDDEAGEPDDLADDDANEPDDAEDDDGADDDDLDDDEDRSGSNSGSG